MANGLEDIISEDILMQGLAGEVKKIMECRDCIAYDLLKQQCHRYPTVYEKGLSDWCMEFKPKEVIVCPVEEKVKVEEARAEEKAESEPAIVVPEVKRGWPKGKPRK